MLEVTGAAFGAMTRIAAINSGRSNMLRFRKLRWQRWLNRDLGFIGLF
jgi:hypothetical protein